MSKGRRKGSRNKGFFFRKNRGWFTKDRRGKFVPLEDESGNRLRKKSDEKEAQLAYARLLLTEQDRVTQAKAGDVTVLEVCTAYLEAAKREGGAANTLECRADTLFDFCYGLPAMWRQKEGKRRRYRPDRQPTAEDKIHPGYGAMGISSLKPLHVEHWLAAHQGWSPSSYRTHIQALKRALNRAIKSGLIEANPLRGMKVTKARARITYLSEEQETTLLQTARPALAMALRVLIRTGMRPAEFAAITKQHVIDHGDRIEVRFKAEEVKTRKVRTVRITDPVIVALFQQQLQKHPKGTVFRNQNDGAWTTRSLSLAFRRALKRARKAGMTFDDDVCLYTCRHTFAKRSLAGHWNGKCINIELLAKLMGNSPAICRDHYLQWTTDFEEALWKVA